MPFYTHLYPIKKIAGQSFGYFFIPYTYFFKKTIDFLGISCYNKDTTRAKP